MHKSILPILLSKEHNKQFLPITTDQSSTEIDFLWGPEEFIKMAKDIVKPEDRNFYAEFWNKGSLEISKQNKGKRGVQLEHALRKTLNQGTILTMLTFNHPKKKSKKSQQTYAQKTLQF